MGHSFLGFILPIYSTLTFLNPEGHFFPFHFFILLVVLSFLFLSSIFSSFLSFPYFPLYSFHLRYHCHRRQQPSHCHSPTTSPITPISFFLSFFSLALYLPLSLYVCVCLFPFLPSCP